jgi:tetraprenyl-beta-curcumene synthase
MSTFGYLPLTLRVSLALIVANARYWSNVAPLVRVQLDHWTRCAKDIPDPTLRNIALANLREEGFNAQATATLATLAPRAYRKSVVEAIVGLQVLYDYLDSLIEQPLADPIVEGRRLYDAFLDAIILDREPQGNYYPSTHKSDDAGYLDNLVGIVRGGLSALPSQSAIAQVSTDAARRCTEAQILAHATAVLGNSQLELWAKNHSVNTRNWQEFLAGSVSSGLALHALTAIAANPSTTHKQALAIDEFYLSVCAVTTLLDTLVDYEQDMHNQGRSVYSRYYQQLDALTVGLRAAIHHATGRARNVPNSDYHLMTLIGVISYYLSASTASSWMARDTTSQIRRELKPLITPILMIMRAWRIAKRTRDAISSSNARCCTR